MSFENTLQNVKLNHLLTGIWGKITAYKIWNLDKDNYTCSEQETQAIQEAIQNLNLIKTEPNWINSAVWLNSFIWFDSDFKYILA